MSTAKGKITTAKIVPGETRIMVRDLGDGKARESATKVKDATAVLVLSKTRYPSGTIRELPTFEGGTRPYPSRRSFFSMTVQDDTGHVMEIGYSTPSQTYWLA